MQNRMHHGHGAVLAAVGGVVSLWGILGLIQMGSWGQAGYDTRWGGEVAHLEPNGPADAAGLEVGDRILGLAGAPIEDPWLNPSRRRVGAGQVQTLQVERAGEECSSESHGSPSPQARFEIDWWTDCSYSPSWASAFGRSS